MIYKCIFDIHKILDYNIIIEVIDMYEKLFDYIDRGIVGIYKITNKLNGKIYIGQSLDIRRR